MANGKTFTVTEQLNSEEDFDALQEVYADLEQAEAKIVELEAKLAKAMKVIDMIASADVDAVLGEAVDISCEIIGELMEEEEDE